MKAIIMMSSGSPDVLEICECPIPQPGPGQVVIRVAYAGINYADVLARRNGYRVKSLPFTPGLEVSGHIQAIGEGIESFFPGQPVVALTLRGGYAEFAVAQADLTLPLERLTDLAVAAGILTIGITAYDMLVHLARMQKGDSILIHSAAGGVGSIASQIARYLGAKLLLGTVGNKQKESYAYSSGYDTVFLRDEFTQAVQAATNGKGVDIVLDASGEPVRNQNIAVLAPFGKLVIFGNASGEAEQSFSPSLLMAGNKAIMGYSLNALAATAPASITASARAVLDLVASGHIKLNITDIFPFSQVREAHTQMEARSSMGKLLLQI